jgi:PadR family transcriptional regulator, regulatory protein PadR
MAVTNVGFWRFSGKGRRLEKRGCCQILAESRYQISPGTLYPLLHGLEKKGYLKGSEVRNGKSLRKVYRATPLGRKALASAKGKVRELFRELIEGK